jgi:hypothetical protein
MRVSYARSRMTKIEGGSEFAIVQCLKAHTMQQILSINLKPTTVVLELSLLFGIAMFVLVVKLRGSKADFRSRLCRERHSVCLHKSTLQCVHTVYLLMKSPGQLSINAANGRC